MVKSSDGSRPDKPVVGGKPNLNSGQGSSSEGRKLKEIQSLVNRQVRQLTREDWQALFWACARFPFSTTQELCGLSGKENELTLNRTQRYLRQAVKWGWLNFVTRYHYPAEVPELNPVIGGTLAGFLYKPGFPISEDTAQTYYKELAARIPTVSAAAGRSRGPVITISRPPEPGCWPLCSGLASQSPLQDRQEVLCQPLPLAPLIPQKKIAGSRRTFLPVLKVGDLLRKRSLAIYNVWKL